MEDRVDMEARVMVAASKPQTYRFRLSRPAFVSSKEMIARQGYVQQQKHTSLESSQTRLERKYGVFEHVSQCETKLEAPRFKPCLASVDESEEGEQC